MFIVLAVGVRKKNCVTSSVLDFYKIPYELIQKTQLQNLNFFDVEEKYLRNIVERFRI